MRLLTWIFLSLMFLNGCSLAPTIVSDSDVSLIDRAYQFEKDHRPIKIVPDTVVLDVRTFFDYQVARVPGAIHVDPRDFSLRKLHGDDLQGKATKLARRLALMGINPFSHVVVIGYGMADGGDEGIISMALLILGVEQVQMGAMKDFKFLQTNKAGPVHSNKRYWEPRVVASLICSAHAGEDITFTIDVSKKAPMTTSSGQKLATIYKNWKEFVKKEDFSPNYNVKSELQKDKIDPQTPIMVHGAQAPIAVFSLLQMGFTRVCMMDE